MLSIPLPWFTCTPNVQGRSSILMIDDDSDHEGMWIPLVSVFDEDLELVQVFENKGSF